MGGDALASLRDLGRWRRSCWPRPGPLAGAAGWAYALTLGFALVYLGEHYVVDLAAGAALVALVRRGEPLAGAAACSRLSAGPAAARAGRRPDDMLTADRLRVLGGMGERPGGWSIRDRGRRSRTRARTTRALLLRRSEAHRPDAASSSSLLVAAIYILLPKLVGLEDALAKLDDGDPVWIAVALVFNVLAFVSYVALFRGVVGEQRAAPRAGASAYQITMAGLAATRLFSAGGAGGIVLTYWALRKAGMERRQTALPDGRLPRPALRGLPGRPGRLRDPAAHRASSAGATPPGLTIVPAAIAGGRDRASSC